MTDSNYQDNSLEDWHRQQAEIERTNAMIEEPKKILRTIGELRTALEPFGEETEIRFEVSGMSAVFGENLCAAALTISADAVIVELLPLFEPEDE
jgi:hypothetical protein